MLSVSEQNTFLALCVITVWLLAKVLVPNLRRQCDDSDQNVALVVPPRSPTHNGNTLRLRARVFAMELPVS